MSARVEIYTCTDCDFRSGSTVVWGSYSYVEKGDSTSDELREIGPVERRVGWCYSCSELTAIEDLPDVPAYLRKKKEIDEKSAVAEDWEERLEEEQGWLDRLLRRKIMIPTELYELQLEISEFQFYDFIPDDLIAAFKARKSPPRCLTCGSTHHLLLNENDPKRLGYESEEQPQILEVEHPGCGGKFVSFYSKIRLAITRKRKKCFDCEGNFVREVEIKRGT